jgi:hypothetical protein
MMTSRWGASEWKQVKPEMKKAMAEKSRIQRAGGSDLPPENWSTGDESSLG